MSLIKNIDESIIKNIANSNEFKGWLLSKRWFSDKFILSNLDFQVSFEYFQIIQRNIILSVVNINKEAEIPYSKSYFLPIIIYKDLDQILQRSEKTKDTILKLTESTFSKKIALTIDKDQKIFTINLIEAEYCLYFWESILFKKEISENYPNLSLNLSLYTEQFQDQENMNKVQNLIEASIYSDRYESSLNQLGKGNTTNMLFQLNLNNLKTNEKYSYVLKSYKEFSESLEPTTLFILVKNDFPNAPKIYGTVKLKEKESIGILEYVPNKGNVGDIYWNELNTLITDTFMDINKNKVKINDKNELSTLLKTYCAQTLSVSESISQAIQKLHESLIYNEKDDYSKESVESEFYLNNYTQKLNLMISDLQHIMQQQSQKIFYNLPKISSVLIDTEDILKKFRAEFMEEQIEIQPVHQDLHMEQILYDLKNGQYHFYFMDFEGDPQLSLVEKKAKYPIEKDLASFLRSLSYIKFNTILEYIEKNLIEKDRYEVPEEILYTLFFRKSSTKKIETLELLLKYLNEWETKLMTKILKDLNPSITLINFYTIERILHELNYEILFRPNKFIVPLLGLKEIVDKN